jgi:F-type H+-transporting ATPase subunit delta
LITSNVAKRYARAFFDVAGGEKRYEEYYSELLRFSTVMDENKNLKEFLSNPVFNKTDKKNVVDKVLQKLNLSVTTANFLKLLTDKGRMGSIAGIEENYRKLMDNAIGLARVQVKTAFPLTPDLSANLKKALESLTAKKVEMQIDEDASLLGGIVVRVGDKLYDGSIKMQLNNMRKLLGEEI